MAAIIPGDTHLVSDAGHVTDHNNAADVLGLLAQALAGMINVAGASNAASIAAIQQMVASEVAASGWPVQVLPSGDTSGTTDVTTVNNALTAASPGGLVQLVPGQWYIKSPLLVPAGVQLAGYKGGINGGSAATPLGTVINPVAAFTAGTSPLTACIVMQEPSTSVAATGNRVRDLAIQGVNAPSGVDGIGMYGAVNGLSIHGVSINQISRRGIAWYNGSTGNDADGFWGDRIMVQKPGYGGFYRIPSDASIHSCHVQSHGNVSLATGIDGAGYYCVNGGNTKFVGCRADLSKAGSGWYLDHAGSGSGYTDAISLIGCGTQRNARHGVHITNSSGTGAAWRDPIIISGSNFDEDGQGGGSGGAFAGVFVEGANLVFVSGSSITQGTIDYAPGCPKFGLLTGTIGSGVTGPTVITWTGGHVNYSSVAGGLPFSDAGNTAFLYFSPEMTSMAGFQTGVIQARNGSVQANGTTAVTVTNAWATTTTRFLVTWTSTGAVPVGVPYVATRSNGSFTLKSTSASDTASLQFSWLMIGS